MLADTYRFLCAAVEGHREEVRAWNASDLPELADALLEIHKAEARKLAVVAMYHDRERSIRGLLTDSLADEKPDFVAATRTAFA